MKSIRRPSVLTIILAILTVAAGRQLAMIVEVRPLEPADGGTLTEVAVRVAPEDRGALGGDVMLWTELTKDGARIFRRGFALKIEDPAAPLRAALVIPDGPHLLRIDLVGANSRSRGVWWGEVDGAFPDPVPAPETEAVPVPESEAVTETETVPVTEAGTATAVATATATSPPSAPSGAEVAPEKLEEAETIDRGRDAPATTVGATVPATVPVTATATATATDTDTVTDTATDTVTDTAAVSASEPVPDAEPAPEPAPEPATASASEPVAAPAAEPAPKADIALVVAWDLHPENASDAPWIGRTVGALAREAKDGATWVLICSHDGSRRSGVEPSGVAGVLDGLGAASAGELSVLVARATTESAAAGGGAPVLVVTDGLGPRPGKGWAEVRAAAAQAGVPVLVAGVWSGDFPSGLRRDLRRLADASGGAVFYLQGPDQAGILVERFAPFIHNGR